MFFPALFWSLNSCKLFMILSALRLLRSFMHHSFNEKIPFTFNYTTDLTKSSYCFLHRGNKGEDWHLNWFEWTSGKLEKNVFPFTNLQLSPLSCMIASVLEFIHIFLAWSTFYLEFNLFINLRKKMHTFNGLLPNHPQMCYNEWCSRFKYVLIALHFHQTS